MPHFKVLYWDQNDVVVRENAKARIEEAESAFQLRRDLRKEDIVVERVVELSEAEMDYERKKGRL